MNRHLAAAASLAVLAALAGPASAAKPPEGDRIPRAEFDARADRMLARLDRNDDARLSRDELPQRRHG